MGRDAGKFNTLVKESGGSLDDLVESCSHRIPKMEDPNSMTATERMGLHYERALFGLPEFVAVHQEMQPLVLERMLKRKEKKPITREENENYANLYLRSTQWQYDAIWSLISFLTLNKFPHQYANNELSGSFEKGNIKSELERLFVDFRSKETDEEEALQQARGLWTGIMGATYLTTTLGNGNFAAAIAPPKMDAFGKTDVVIAPKDKVGKENATDEIRLLQVKSTFDERLPTRGVEIDSVDKASIYAYIDERKRQVSSEDVRRKWEAHKAEADSSFRGMEKYVEGMRNGPDAEQWKGIDTQERMCYVKMHPSLKEGVLPLHKKVKAWKKEENG
jgi:hypothetical protein